MVACVMLKAVNYFQSFKEKETWIIISQKVWVWLINNYYYVCLSKFTKYMFQNGVKYAEKKKKMSESQRVTSATTFSF